MAVTDQLDLDVARLFDKFFDEHTVIAKTVTRLVAATGKALEGLFVVKGHPQALATAASAGLDHYRIANALGNLHRLLRRFNRVVNTRDAVHTRFARQLLRLDLVTHGSNRVVLGADEDDALFFAAPRELGVLTQETIAGVHRLRSRLLAGGNDFVGQQVTLAAGCRANVHGLVGQRHMARFLVCVRIHGYRFDPHFAGSSDDAAGNFAAVGNQNFGKHAYLQFNVFSIALRCSVKSHQGRFGPPFINSFAARKVSSKQGSCRCPIGVRKAS